MANINIQEIKLGAPSSIEGGASPNAVLSVQSMLRCESVILHDEDSKCTSVGAIASAANLMAWLKEELDAPTTEGYSIFIKSGVEALWQGGTLTFGLKHGDEEVTEPLVWANSTVTIPSDFVGNVEVTAKTLDEEVKVVKVFSIDVSSSSAIIENCAELLAEYPELVNSLIDTSQENVLYNNHLAWIDTNYIDTGGLHASMKVSLLSDDCNNYEGLVTSQEPASANYRNYLSLYNGNSLCYGIGTWFENDKYKLVLGQFYNIEICTYSGIEQFLKVDNNTVFNITSVYSQEGSTSIRLFRPGSYNSVADVKISYANIFASDGTLVRKLVPFIRNGEAGMINIAPGDDFGHFYGNANTTGSFTIITEDK